MAHFREDHVKQDESHIQCVPGGQAGDSKTSLEPGRARQSLAAHSSAASFQVGLVCPSLHPKYPALSWVTASGTSFCHSPGSRWGRVVTNVEFEGFLPRSSILEAAPAAAAQALEGREIPSLPFYRWDTRGTE